MLFYGWPRRFETEVVFTIAVAAAEEKGRVEEVVVTGGLENLYGDGDGGGRFNASVVV